MDTQQAEEEMNKDFDTHRQQAELFYKNVIVQRIKELKELWESFSKQGMFKVPQIAGRSQDESPKTSDKAYTESKAQKTPQTSDSNEEESRGTKRKIQDTEVEPQIKTGMDEVDGDTTVSVLQQNTKAKTDILMCDPALTTLMDALKPYLTEALIHCNDLISMIYFLLPKFADQNSLHEDIHTKVLSRIRTLMTDCEKWHAYISKFHERRAKLVSKTVKYPTVEQYRIAVSQCDEKLRTFLLQHLLTFRNSYSELYDVLIKNIPSLQELSKESSASMTN